MLGEHDGIERFTIGQRKGLGIAAGKRYVLDIVPETRTVVLGDKEDLAAEGLLASQVKSCPLKCPRESFAARPRSATATPALPPLCTTTPDGNATVQFDERQPAVTPGQAVAFYDGTRVWGWVGLSRRWVE